MCISVDRSDPNQSSVPSTTPATVNLSSILGMKRKHSNFNKPSTIGRRVIQYNCRSYRLCVVLLKNMVSAGEVDGALGEETKQECSKYGPVRRCVVRTLSERDGAMVCPDEERVRVFVVFETQESAVKAYR